MTMIIYSNCSENCGFANSARFCSGGIKDSLFYRNITENIASVAGLKITSLLLEFVKLDSDSTRITESRNRLYLTVMP